MNAEFQVSKGRPKIQVVLTRDSVCAGDDCDAPHEKTVEVYAFIDPELFAKTLSSDYLPSVNGIGHTWVCELNGIKIAELASSTTRALEPECLFSDQNRAHFIYHSAQY